MLALAVAAVEERPEFRPLVFRIPLPELVPEAEDPLLGARLFFVAPSAAEHGVELVLLNACSSGTVWIWLREARGPVGSVTMPCAMASSTEATTSRAPISATRRSRKSMTSGKL